MKSDEPKRLAPRQKTIKLLLLRSGNQCAFPGCSHSIFNDKNILISECCHIEGALPGGERFNPNQTNEERRSYHNLLFLCHNHHIETNDEVVYTAEKIKEIKANHENKFKEQKFEIKPIYISQVTDLFGIIKDDVRSTLDVTKRIEAKQDYLIELLTESNNESIDSEIRGNDYFGAPVNKGFVGRKKELEKLSEAYANNNTFQILGISGIGKSSIVSEFISKFGIKEYVWIDCDLVDSMDKLNYLVGNYLVQTFNDHNLLSENKNLSKEGILKALIKATENYSLCIVLDNISSCKHGLFFTLERFNTYLSNSKFIYTTTQDIKSTSWSNPVFQLKLAGLDFLSFQEIVSQRSIKLDIEEQFEIHSLISGHPYLLKFVISILEYCPVNVLLEDLRNKKNNEISDYIKTRILNNLSKGQLKLLQFITLLDIPFRFQILNFIEIESKREIFNSLQKRNLINIQSKDYFTVPEFIRSYLEGYFPFEDKTKSYGSAYNYLNSLGMNKRLFERISIIHLGIKGGFINDAFYEASDLINALMSRGYFSIVHKLCVELNEYKVSSQWDFIHFAKGRVLRFNNCYNEALKEYENVLELSKDPIFKIKSEFEIASVYTYLATDLNDEGYNDKAIRIYDKLSKSDDSNIAIQSWTTLANDLIKRGELSQGIEKLNFIAENYINESIEPNVIASFWQIFGTAYSKKEEYQQSIDCFEKSFIHYEEAIKKYGMNTIDGLYNAYDGLAWTYAKGGLLYDAVQMFGIASDLSRNFGLTEKFEKSLFDYGYHLILIEEYKEAAKVLSSHYDILLANKWFEESDMFLIYSALAFSHWYSGLYEDAIQLLGLYINESYKLKNRPPVSVIPFASMNDNIQPLDWFNKRALILILPEDKTLDDFSMMVSKVVKAKPELYDVLSSFAILKKDEN